MAKVTRVKGNAVHEWTVERSEWGYSVVYRKDEVAFFETLDEARVFIDTHGGFYMEDE